MGLQKRMTLKRTKLLKQPNSLKLLNTVERFQTPACDLKSLLAVGLKRKILQELEKGCPAYAGEPKAQEEIYEKYHKYLAAVSERFTLQSRSKI